MNFMRPNAVPRMAVDLKRSALAVAMVMLKELDEALPEKHGAQAVVGALLSQPSRSGGASELEVITDEQIWRARAVGLIVIAFVATLVLTIASD